MTDLNLAMESSDALGPVWYIHRNTGGIIPVSEDEQEMMAVLDDPLARAYRKSKKGFLKIEPMSSRDAYALMEAFAEAVEDDGVRERLIRALHGRRPFRQFKDALPDTMREAWYRHHDAALRRYAEEWLQSHLPQAVLSPQ